MRNLRKMYEEQMRVAQEEWLKLHQSKVSIAIMTMMKITTTPKAVTDHIHNYLPNNVNNIINSAKQQFIIINPDQLAELEAALARERGQNSRFV